MTTQKLPPMDLASGLRVAMNVRITPGLAGGVVQSTVGLVQSLGQLDDGPEQYILVVGSPDQADWLRTYCGPNQQIVVYGNSQAPKNNRRRLTLKRAANFALRPLSALGRHLRKRLNMPRIWPEVPLSDGFFEG